MTSKTKIYVFIACFSSCILLFFLLPNFPAGAAFVKAFNISGWDPHNFILLMLAFVLVAYVMTELIGLAGHWMMRMNWRTPRIGRILVSQGFISKSELARALQEQGYRIGEILVQEGRLSADQLADALARQKKNGRPIGEILMSLGYVSDEDIRWALGKTHRRLGEILEEKKLVTDYEITCALSLKGYRIDAQGRIFEKD